MLPVSCISCSIQKLDGASQQQIPAAVGEAREEGLQGAGLPTVTLAQNCTRVCSPVAEAMEGSFLTALDKDQAYMFTPSELRMYRHAQDHRLQSRDILGYPSLFGNILAQPLISKVIPFSGGLRSSKESRDLPPPRGSQALRRMKRMA